ncbi:MAG: LUD domain-containing protein [Acidobacteriota bacterium]
MTAREQILATIRGHLGTQASNPAASHALIPATYNRIGRLSPEARLELFLDRLTDYDSEIHVLPTSDAIPATIAQVLATTGETQLIASTAFPSAWLPSTITPILDGNLSIEEVGVAQAVVTTCESAVASTGTIILVHQGAQGRRLITLLPDHHICIVRRDQIFEHLPEALTPILPNARLPITTISGPSATSDIEMTRIRGVHGPRRLTVLIY